MVANDASASGIVGSVGTLLALSLLRRCIGRSLKDTTSLHGYIVVDYYYFRSQSRLCEGSKQAEAILDGASREVRSNDMSVSTRGQVNTSGTIGMSYTNWEPSHAERCGERYR